MAEIFDGLEHLFCGESELLRFWGSRGGQIGKSSSCEQLVEEREQWLHSLVRHLEANRDMGGLAVAYYRFDDGVVLPRVVAE